MGVWIAEESFNYEGSTILGVFVDETKAMAKCENKWAEISEQKLVWDNGIAQGHNDDHHFSITRYEVE